jgi:glycerol uptake facilitator-like aquaporin/N-acetylglutamate synthase-like GNAT family acetyltransferase
MITASRRLAAEALGTSMLIATVIGSGIMAERLSGGNQAIALLCNTLPTGAILVVLITIFGHVSGAHFNPAVSLVFGLRRELTWLSVAAYCAVQIAGGIMGALLAHAMFELPLLQLSTNVRTGIGQWTAEVVATFGLVLTILGCLAHNARAIPMAVGLYITAAYWFTASTSFANPAVTIARALSNTFAGIAPNAVVAFLLAQTTGALLAYLTAKWIWGAPGGSVFRLTANDPAMIELLRKAALPTRDLHGTNKQFVGIRDGKHLIAAGGLERHGSYGLVRSVVVAEGQRAVGNGTRILQCLLNEAHPLGLKEIYLLTTTAERFFQQIGFERIERDVVPAEIQQTAEFSELCPKSATVMRRELYN